MTKNNSIEFLRVSSMAIVVLLHCLCFYGNWTFSDLYIDAYVTLVHFLFNISMPMFAFISGCLYTHCLNSGYNNGYDTNRSFLWKKFKRLIIPYLIWGIVIITLFPNRYDCSMLLFGISHLWFLMALMMIFAMIHLMRRFWQSLSFSASLFALAVIIAIKPVVCFSPIPDLFAIRSLFILLPAFVAGALFPNLKLQIKDKRIGYKLLGILIILFISVYVKDLILSADSKDLVYFIQLYLIEIICTILSICVCVWGFLLVDNYQIAGGGVKYQMHPWEYILYII